VRSETEGTGDKGDGKQRRHGRGNKGEGIKGRVKEVIFRVLIFDVQTIPVSKN
jgi:hypothetical protein